jgi:predicted nuclease with TOPRIM domain
MSEKQVITKDELKSVEELRSSSTDLIFQFGQVEMEIIMLQDRLKELTTHKDSLQTQYKELQEKEATLVDQFNTKYGAGTLNIENGEFVAS